MGYPYNNDSASMGGMFASGGQTKREYFMSDGAGVAAFGVPISAEQAGKLLGIDLSDDQLKDPKFARVVRQAKALADELKSILKAIEKEKADKELPAEPERTTGMNRIITFTKKYNGSQCYHYVAIRPHGKKGWTISGRPSMGTDVPWSKLLEFVQKDELDPKRALTTILTLQPGKYLADQ